jgi:hypothetical protein
MSCSICTNNADATLLSEPGIREHHIQGFDLISRLSQILSQILTTGCS